MRCLGGLVDVGIVGVLAQRENHMAGCREDSIFLATFAEIQAPGPSLNCK